MAKPGVVHIPSKIIYWWGVFNVKEEGFDFHRNFVRILEIPPVTFFNSGYTAFEDFKTKRASLIEGETLVETYKYASSRSSSVKMPSNGHVILSKDDGTVAVLVNKNIACYTLMASYPRTPSKLLEEMERLRNDNITLRFKDEGKTRFYVPRIDSLENTREIANAFATFFGSFMVRHRPDVGIRGAGFHRSQFIRNVDGIRCHTLLFNVQNKKEAALVHSSATTLGLTKDTFQKSVMHVTKAFMDGTTSKVVSTHVQLEYIEFDTSKIIDDKFEREAEFAQFEFKSNQPLMRFIYECVGKQKSAIPGMIDSFDEEQAVRMLKAMAAGTTNTFDTIEVMSQELCSYIDILCKHARTVYTVDSIEDRLWIFKIKKESDEVGNPSST